MLVRVREGMDGMPKPKQESSVDKDAERGPHLSFKAVLAVLQLLGTRDTWDKVAVEVPQAGSSKI